MNGARGATRSFPVEEFLQSLTAQLDRAQDTLALKVRAGRPLTWALKDLSLDLMVFVEVDGSGRVLMRSAAANESGASTLHINLTTITRPMVEENTWAFQQEADPRSLDAIRQAASLDEDDQRKLEWMGIRTVGQLKRLTTETSPGAVEATIGLPVSKLRAALEASSRPMVSGQEVVERDDGPLLRIHGANLSDNLETEVHLAGEPVEIVEARPDQLLVRPLSHHVDGQVEVFVSGQRATGFFRLPRAAGERYGGAARTAGPRANGANGANSANAANGANGGHE